MFFKRFISKKLLLILFFVYPYVFAIDIYLKFTGHKIFISFVFLITLGFIFIFAFSLASLLRREVVLSVVFTLISVLFVIFFRSALYEEVVSIFEYRTFFLLIVYSCSLYFVLENSGLDFKRKLLNVMMFNFFIQAVVGIIHTLYFPNIVVGIELDDSGDSLYVLDVGEGGFRESGLLIGANVYGNFLALGVFLLLGIIKNTREKFKLKEVLFFFAYFFLLTWAVYLSGSRLALFSVFVFLFCIFVATFGIKYSFFPVIFGFLVLLFSPILDTFVERTVNHGSGGRIDKINLALDMLFSNPVSFMFGASEEVVSNAKTLDGLAFSDNSFFLVFLNYGVPVGILLIFGFLYLLFKRSIVNLYSLAFFFYILMTLFFNNSILWDIWLVYVFAVYYLIFNSKLKFCV